MTKVLFITKDVASRPAVALAARMRRGGHTVTVVAEGLSVAAWRDAGFEFLFQGTRDFRLEPFTLDAAAVLREAAPQLLVVCEGDPNHLERAFAEAAINARIPCIVFEDIWNGFRRLELSAPPDAVLTIDEYAKQLAEIAYPQSKISVVGSWQVSFEEPHELPASVRERLHAVFESNPTPIVLFIGGEATDDLQLVIDSMSKMNGYLVPRFHPKHKMTVLPDGRRKEEVWRRMLEPLRDRVLWFDEIKDSNVLIPAADVVCSGMGLSLLAAACAGKPTLVLQTPEVKAVLERANGLSVYPLVSLGVATAIQEPTNLLNAARAPDRSKLVPFDVERAYEAISSLVS